MSREQVVHCLLDLQIYTTLMQSDVSCEGAFFQFFFGLESKLGLGFVV